MVSVSNVVRQQVTEVSALIEKNHVQEASEKIHLLIRELPLDILILVAPNLRTLINELLPKRRRDLTNILDAALAQRRPPGPTYRPATEPPESSLATYASRLDTLRDKHIFQWATHYREATNFIVNDLLQRLQSVDQRSAELERVSAEFSRHATAIYGHGLRRVLSQGLSFDVGEIKSINGLQRFLQLVVNLFLDRRDAISGSKMAELLWEVTSSLIVGIIRGYGQTDFYGTPGWLLLGRHKRAWIAMAGFARGTDVLALFDDFPTEHRPDDAYKTLVPTLLGLESFSSRFHGADLILPRLSRVAIGEPPRLDITLSISESGILRDLIVSAFFEGPVLDRRLLDEAIQLRAALVIGRLEKDVKESMDDALNRQIFDANEVECSASPAQNFSEMIRAALDADLSDEAASSSGLLVRNYARDFPLEETDLRAFFMVERPSVKRLLEELDRETGVRLWCSVRRSGKTTAAMNLADIGGRSIVNLQCMLDRPNSIEQNVLINRIKEALTTGSSIPGDFFQNVVRACIASGASPDIKDKKIVLILDEYESLFGQIAAHASANSNLKQLVVYPLLSQMVGFATKNVLILLGQRPDAHLIYPTQNQLSPHVRQFGFPLFEHKAGAPTTEFTQFISRVLTAKIPFNASFADAVYAETGGHPYLTVNMLVDFCDWLIVNHALEAAEPLEASNFAAFAQARLTPAALRLSPHYVFFQRMIAIYLSENGIEEEPWLWAIHCILKDIGRLHPKVFSCPLGNYVKIATPLAQEINEIPERILVSAVNSNFLKTNGGQVTPGIRLMARLAACVTQQVN